MRKTTFNIAIILSCICFAACERMERKGRSVTAGPAQKHSDSPDVERFGFDSNDKAAAGQATPEGTRIPFDNQRTRDEASGGWW